MLLINNKFNILKENEEDYDMKDMKIKLIINEYELTATLVNNLSTSALIDKLNNGDIIVEMSDYANMEKVGNLGFDLPRNDENIETEPGDLILYQGNNFVIYYDNNNWYLTRIGKIDNISSSELRNILGSGNVTVTLSLNK